MHVGNEMNHNPNHCCLKTKCLQHAIAGKPKGAYWFHNRLRMFWSGALHAGCAGFRIFQNLCDPAKPRAMQRQKQVVDFKKVGMASRRDVVCCCVNWHRTGKSVRKTGCTHPTSVQTESPEYFCSGCIRWSLYSSLTQLQTQIWTS